MIGENEISSRNRYGIMGMWVNWVMAAGSFILVLAVSLFVRKFNLPMFCLAICLALYMAVRRNRRSTQPVCYVLPFTMARIMFFSAMIMIFINMLHKRNMLDLIFTDVELVNPDIPFVTLLVISPVAVVFAAYKLLLGVKNPFCAECIRRNGEEAERGRLGQFYSREGRYQLRLLLIINIVNTIGGYLYYFFVYANINYNRLDLFAYNYAPIAIWFFSIVYMTIRYLGVWHYFKQNVDTSEMGPGRTTRVRFLIVSGDQMLLNVPDLKADLDFYEMRVDTPVELTLRHRDNVTLEEAKRFFTNYTNISDVPIKELYSNKVKTNDFTVYYFLVTLPSTEIPEEARLKGEWFTMRQVTDMLNNGALDPLLAAEILRLYKMTMAWKAYDEHGMRRYKIKNYSPGFRLSDLGRSDINFNDLRWLYISQNNEDKPFFKLRRFWSRHVSGSAKSR